MRHRRFPAPLALLTAAAAAMVVAACSGGTPTSTSPPPLLTDVTGAAGVNSEQGSGDMSAYPFTGQAWGDMDKDGRPDLFLTAATGGNVLWHNLGGGTFEVSTWSEDTTLPLNRSGRANFADADGDGWLDISVATAEGLVLLRNLEGMGFADVTAAAGLAGAGPAPTALAWGDLDGDGYADLYVVHGGCAACGADMADRLYRNNGDGTFTDISASVARARADGAGTDAAWVDVEGDGDEDLVVSADAAGGGEAVTVLLNAPAACTPPCLVEATVPALSALGPTSARAVTAADLGDRVAGGAGNPVVFVATSDGLVALGTGPGGWTNLTGTLGLDRARVDAAGIAAADVDGDGVTDLYVTAASGDDKLFLGRRDGAGAAFTDEGTSERIPTHTGAGPGAGAAAEDQDGAGVMIAAGELAHPYRLLAGPGSR